MTSASCVNPSLTYMALTARACDYAVERNQQAEPVSADMMQPHRADSGPRRASAAAKRFVARRSSPAWCSRPSGCRSSTARRPPRGARRYLERRTGRRSPARSPTASFRAPTRPAPLTSACRRSSICFYGEFMTPAEQKLLIDGLDGSRGGRQVGARRLVRHARRRARTPCCASIANAQQEDREQGFFRADPLGDDPRLLHVRAGRHATCCTTIRFPAATTAACRSIRSADATGRPSGLIPPEAFATRSHDWPHTPRPSSP